ncbi:MAG: N,N'-diacetylchitobiose phosphorylase [Blautia sp.]|nr:N,N'-diacetylchitobiose phosphorylase [Blautia sp.]
MKYGYFDNERREYVITRPDTPAPWANYLGSPRYGAIISNNAGGYSFARSGANGRILRYIFNGADQPGRYIYMYDEDRKDYWSASWQPVGKDPGRYKSECRHGTGYTTISADYEGIHSEALFYVPMDREHEVWCLTVENRSDTVRKLSVTGYAEFTSHSNYEQDQVNLQYSLFISRTLYEEGLIRQQIHGNLDGTEGEKNAEDQEMAERFFGLAGQSVSSWCGDREGFLGRYHGYGNPVGVENNDLGNILGYNENSCGALMTRLSLKPRERKVIAFVLGMKHRDEAVGILKSYENTQEVCQREKDELISCWHGRLSHFQVMTPSPEFDTMINTWNAYNCFMTFIWSRAASLIYCGLRNGYGYRDTVQDIQGIIHLAPEMARDKIRFMLSAQVDNGGGLPLVKFTHNAGCEDTPDDPSYVKATGHPAYRADDALWLFPTVYKYVAETGDLAFMDEMIPFANRGEGTVYDHLKRAIGFSLERMGPHGLPAGLHADWNDCLRLGKAGESTFVAFQFYYALGLMKRFAAYRQDTAYISFLEEQKQKLGEILDQLCWNEDRYIRGFTEAGQVIGNRLDPEANLWLNPQSWAVISSLADGEKADKALETVYERLNTAYGAILMDPPYHAHAFEGALAVIYNAGVKENAGIFSQTQGWIILAEALRGHGERAFAYFMENAPSAQNDRAEIRRMEPYCYGQFTEGKASPHFGRSHVHWLTGTASTVMVGCVEGILGMRPDFYGLRISPAVPKEWGYFEIEKDFRGSRLHIKVYNEGHKEAGCSLLTVNGKEMKENYIPADELAEENEVILRIS